MAAPSLPVKMLLCTAAHKMRPTDGNLLWIPLKISLSCLYDKGEEVNPTDNVPFLGIPLGNPQSWSTRFNIFTNFTFNVESNMLTEAMTFAHPMKLHCMKRTGVGRQLYNPWIIPLSLHSTECDCDSKYSSCCHLPTEEGAPFPSTPAGDHHCWWVADESRHNRGEAM